jgi:hypothetical protein
MRNKLLATVAVAAVVGFGGFAAAQGQMGGQSKGTSGATSGAASGAASGTTQERSGAGMSGTQSGSKTLSPSSTQSSNPARDQSAQDKSGKDNQRLGQGRNDNESTRGAQQENNGMQQKGAQQEPGLQKNQKGAQDQRGNNRAQEQQRGTTERNATEQNGRTGVNVGERGRPGGSTQLSEDQRSQIKTVIGRERGPRLGNANFDVRVGTRIPHSVHYAVLPPDIVRIVPQYRGFNYFLVQDEIVIVDPRTLEIVAIIPA